MFYKNVPVDASKIAFVDLETTGLSPVADLKLNKNHPEKYHRVLEVGAYTFEVSTSEFKVFQKLVNPKRPIPWEATRIHGIKDEDVSDAEDAITVFREMNKFIEDCDIVLGFNAPFDLKFMIHEYRLANEEPPNTAYFDVGRLAARLGYGRLGLGELCSVLEVQRSTNQHRTVPDAYDTAQCFKILIDKHFSGMSVSQIVKKHNETTPVYCTARAQKALDLSDAKYQPTICVTGKVEGLLRNEIPICAKIAYII